MPQERLNKVLYVLNFLRLTGDRKEPPALIHHRALMEGEHKQEKVLVPFKNLQTGQWEGPAEVKLTGRGCMCLLTENGVRWAPAQWVRPWKGPDRDNSGADVQDSEKED